MNTTFRVWLPIAIIFAMLFAFGTGLYTVVDHQASYRQREETLNNVVRYSAQLLSRLTDAETAERGFVITGADRYLDPFKAAQIQIPQIQHSLHASTDKDPAIAEMVRQLDMAVAGKMSSLHETIMLRREKGLDAATQMVLTDHGVQYMDDVRTLVEGITAKERGELTKTIGRQESLSRHMKLLLVTAGPLILLLAMLGIRLSTRRISKSIKLLEQAVLSMGSGGATTNIAIGGSDEFSRLAASFNSMAARLSAAGFAQNRAEAQLREKKHRACRRPAAAGGSHAGPRYTGPHRAQAAGLQ